jgi:hypothetical protein
MALAISARIALGILPGQAARRPQARQLSDSGHAGRTGIARTVAAMTSTVGDPTAPMGLAAATDCRNRRALMPDAWMGPSAPASWRGVFRRRVGFGHTSV